MTIEQVIARYGLSVWSAADAAAFGRDVEERLGRALPSAALRFASAPRLAHELARAYTAQVVFPDRVEPADADLGPGVDEACLSFMTENQGVCDWVVPLDAGDDPPVLVVGDLSADSSPQVYARSLDEFADAWAWDRACMELPTVIQAQAAGLDADTEHYLRSTFSAAITTWAWPTRRALRLESADGLMLTVWDDPEQCDWFVAGHDLTILRRHVTALVAFSDLASSFWSNDDEGDTLLAEIRTR